MKCSELNKYCFYILLTVALSTFLINLISNPGEYLAKLKKFEQIERAKRYSLVNGDEPQKIKLEGQINIANPMLSTFKIQQN